LDGFEGERNPKTGKKYAPTLKVVTEFKLRPALVIQNDKPDFELLLPEIIITDAMKRLAQYFEIRIIKECYECQRNCDNYEYKIAVNK
jgi:hypothetical protein